MTSHEPSSDDHDPKAIPHEPPESDTASQPDSPPSFTTTRLELEALRAMVRRDPPPDDQPDDEPEPPKPRSDP